MNALRKLGCSILLLVAVGMTGPAAAHQWLAYNAPDYGFSMLVPEGAQLQSRQWPGGWGGLSGSYEGVTLFAMAKLGVHENPAAIEQFGVQLTGIPAEAWEEFDAGVDKGWEGYRAVRADLGDRVIFGGYGIGPKGTYLILLETTHADYDAYEDEFEDWFESVRLY